jgi:predicted RecA/RadA family phage recombinase
MSQVFYSHLGDSIDYTPTADVAAGDVVVQSELVGIAKQPIKAGQLGALAVAGVFDFPVTSLTGWAVGDRAYWDNTAKVATETQTGNKYLGKVVLVDSRPGSGSSYVRVRLSQ